MFTFHLLVITAEWEIRATPEYIYRMTVILCLQLYWGQTDHINSTRYRHEKCYISEKQEIPEMNNLLNATHMYVNKKCNELKNWYTEIYAGKTTWSKFMTLYKG